MDEAGFTWPGLSTIKVDKAGIGRAVAHCLLGLGEAEGRILPPRLIDRGTVGPVPHV